MGTTDIIGSEILGSICSIIGEVLAPVVEVFDGGVDSDDNGLVGMGLMMGDGALRCSLALLLLDFKGDS